MSRMTRIALAAVAALAVLAAPAAAAPLQGDGAGPAPSSARAVDRAPQELPARGARAAAAGDWLVGARPGRAAGRLAAEHGAEALAYEGAFRVAGTRARGFAAALREAGLLRWSEPNRELDRQSSFEGNGREAQWSRGTVVAPGLAPPGAGAPIGVADDLVDTSVADVAHAKLLNGGRIGVVGPHGTEVASVAAGAANGAGVLGVLPSAPLLSYGLSENTTCEEASDGIIALTRAGAKVINLSLGSTEECFLLQLSIADAFANDTLTVASSGNEFDRGNPVVYPAAYPHVVSVAAVDELLDPAFFSSANAAVDLAAPGERIPVAIPPQFDTKDGARDGVSTNDGTSFAAPIVAGVASWVMAARPKLEPGQVADVLRRSARDLGRAGWDENTGYGLVDLARALQQPDPPIDPLEPNDGITFVNGTAYTRADPYVWKGSGKRSLKASVDAVEDPVDVYRIRVPAGKRVTIRLSPSAANADLYVYDARAKSVEDRAVARSRKAGRKTDRARVRNTTRKARTAYVAVFAPSIEAASHEAPYTLRFSRP